jgi:hypothetical protein
VDRGLVADGELDVVAGRHRTVAFEPVDPALQSVALLVGVGVERWWPFTLGPSLAPVGGLIVLDWDRGLDPSAAQAGPVGLGTVGLVGQHPIRPGPRPPCPSRGTRMPSRTATNCGLSPRWPAVMTIDSGRWPCSQARCSLVVSPPRDRPSPWSAGSRSIPPGGSTWRSPFCAPGRVLVGPRDGGVHADVPGDQPGRIRAGLQPGQELSPGPVALPASKQPVDAGPRPVLGRHVPPRRVGAGPPPHPVDELPSAPGGWAARLLALGEQRLQDGPLRVGQVGAPPHRPPRVRCPRGSGVMVFVVDSSHLPETSLRLTPRPAVTPNRDQASATAQAGTSLTHPRPGSSTPGLP